MMLSDFIYRADLLFQNFSVYLNALVIALVILLSGFIIGRLVDRALHKFFLRTGFDDRCYKIFGFRRDYARATRRALVFAIYTITVYMALKRLHVATAATAIVLVLLALILLVSVIFATFEIVPNLFAHARLRKQRISEGDRVIITDTTGTFRGKIKEITLTDVHIKRSNGDLVFYPVAALLNVKLTKRKTKKKRSK